AYQRLADSLEHVGDFRGARAAYVEAADFCRANGAASMGDVCLACLTMVLRQGGDWDHACDLCREVLESSSSNLHAQAVAHGVLGRIMFHRAATAALTTIESQPDEEAHAGANLALAEGLMTEGDAAAAVARFEQALTILADLELPLDRAEIELRAAAAYMLTGDRQTAGA